LALEVASSPHDFKLMLQAGGQRASGIEQVMQENGNGHGGGPAETDSVESEPVAAPDPRQHFSS
jgi:hypothetical protein